MSIYSFCNGCTAKFIKYDDNGKIVDHGCPARYNPFDEKIVEDPITKEIKKTSDCIGHDKFMMLERQKNIRNER